jgi:hypothetical protein
MQTTAAGLPLDACDWCYQTTSILMMTHTSELKQHHLHAQASRLIMIKFCLDQQAAANALVLRAPAAAPAAAAG